MQGLFLEYKDPLFGIIVFVSVIFVVALLTYLWNLYVYRYSNRHIIEFINSFNSSSKPKAVEALLNSKEIPNDALELLARNYYKSGQYEVTIEIAIDMLKKRNVSRRDTLLLLAKSYYKAGFYKRSESTLVELLRYSTQEPRALEYLIIIYERLQRFSDALDALEALKEMGHDTKNAASFIKVTRTIREVGVSALKQGETLLKLYRENPRMLRPVFMHLFRTQPQLAWQHLPVEHYQEIIDILWNLPESSLDLDIITQNHSLQALFYAKGVCDTSAQSDIFEVNVLNTLKQNNESIATLQFEYQCQECREITPLMNHRCPHCMSLLTLEVQTGIVERKHLESYYSF